MACRAAARCYQESERRVEDRYQAEMGTAAALARTDAYMRAATVNHADLVDPTGRWGNGAPATARATASNRTAYITAHVWCALLHDVPPAARLYPFCHRQVPQIPQ